MSDPAPPSELRFFTAPISVHTVSAPDLDRQFRKRLLIGTIAVIPIGALYFLLVFIAFTGLSRPLQGDYVLMVAASLLAGAPVGVGLSIVIYLKYTRRINLATTYELWPDALVYRVAGRPL